MKKISFWTILLTVATAMTSCNRKTVYDKYEHTPLMGWEKNDTLKFDIPTFQTGGRLREDIGLRINDSYPFMGLCLIVEQTIHPSKVTKSDTINCRLYDHDGDVRGQGVSYYQYSIPLTMIDISDGDSVEIRIRHNMKREILPGISDIGVKISRP